MLYIIDNIYEYLLEPIIIFSKNKFKTYNKFMQFLSGWDNFLNAIIDHYWLLSCEPPVIKVWKREFYNSLNSNYSDIEANYYYK